MTRANFENLRIYQLSENTRKLITAKQTETLSLLISELTPSLNAYLSSVSRSASKAKA